MFESPQATKLCIVSTAQWWRTPVGQDHSGISRRLWWILLTRWVFWHDVIIHNWCGSWFYRCVEVFCEICYLIIILLPIVFNCVFDGFELFMKLVIRIFASFWNIESWGMKSSIVEVVHWLLVGAIWRRWASMSEWPGEISVFITWLDLRDFGGLRDRI